MATDAELIAKYRQYNPAFDRYTDEEITQLGLRGFDTPMGVNTYPQNTGIQNIIGSGIENVTEGLGYLKDKASQGFDFAQQLPGMAISAAMGVPFVGQGIIAGLNALQDLTGPNYRAFQEQELSNMGYNIDNIGRAVSGPGNYNTAQNVVGGYNLSDDDMVGGIFDRISNIENRKMAQTQSSLNRIEALKQAALDISKAKRLAYERAIQEAKEKEDRAREERARVKSISAGYGGYDDSPGATGPTAAGAGMGVGGGYASDYGFLRDGGLASLAHRRG